MKVTSLILMTLLMVWTTSAKGQVSPDSITFGTATLTIGMQKEIVIGKLGQSYELKSSSLVSGGDTWIIVSKGGPPVTAYGDVSFSNEKLDVANKVWNIASDGKDVSFAQALYGAISALVKEGKEICKISTEHHEQPGMDSNSVYLFCSQRKYLNIGIVRIHDHGESANITEVLLDPK
ncbi:MAG: hypothetical protein HYS38_09850 [Acidobacteria bacterium]|nr:hypothetical protein [Acidobacteriota bacterium]